MIHMQGHGTRVIGALRDGPKHPVFIRPSCLSVRQFPSTHAVEKGQSLIKGRVVGIRTELDHIVALISRRGTPQRPSLQSGNRPQIYHIFYCLYKPVNFQLACGGVISKLGGIRIKGVCQQGGDHEQLFNAGIGRGCRRFQIFRKILRRPVQGRHIQVQGIQHIQIDKGALILRLVRQRIQPAAIGVILDQIFRNVGKIRVIGDKAVQWIQPALRHIQRKFPRLVPHDVRKISRARPCGQIFRCAILCRMGKIIKLDIQVGIYVF